MVIKFSFHSFQFKRKKKKGKKFESVAENFKHEVNIQFFSVFN